MELKFASKVYTGQKKKFRFWNLFMNLIAAVICVCVLIKIVVGDFSFSDISGILISFLLISLSRNKLSGEKTYGCGECILKFEPEKMTITYPLIHSDDKKGSFKENVIIRYEDIENIEYGKALECFRIVACCDRKREYQNQPEHPFVQLSDPDYPEETFLYVLDEEMQDQVLKSISKYAEFIVRVIED